MTLVCEGSGIGAECRAGCGKEKGNTVEKATICAGPLTRSLSPATPAVSR